MANKGYKSIMTGLGAGLLAASLAGPASAGFQSFGSSMIFYKAGTTPAYVLTVPSGNQATDSVLMVELTLADSAKNTWGLGVTSATLSATAGGLGEISFNSAAVVSATITTVLSNGASTAYQLTDSNTQGPQLAGLWGGGSRSWLIPASDSISLPFNGVSTVGSGTGAAYCSYTFKVTVDTDGNLKVNTATASISVKPSGLDAFSKLAAGTSVWILTNATSGTNLAASQWASYGSAALAGWDAQSGGGTTGGAFPFATSVLKSVYSTSSAQISSGTATSANPNLAASQWPTNAINLVNAINSCNAAVYSNRIALNNSGLVVAGNNGLARVW